MPNNPHPSFAMLYRMPPPRNPGALDDRSRLTDFRDGCFRVPAPSSKADLVVAFGNVSVQDACQTSRTMTATCATAFPRNRQQTTCQVAFWTSRRSWTLTRLLTAASTRLREVTHLVREKTHPWRRYLAPRW